MELIKWVKGVFEGKQKLATEQRQLKEIDDQLDFVKSEALTLGVTYGETAHRIDSIK